MADAIAEELARQEGPIMGARYLSGLGGFATKMGPQGCEIWIILMGTFTQLSLIGSEAMVIIVFFTSVVSMSVEAVHLKDLFHPAPGLPGCLFILSSSKSLTYTLTAPLVLSSTVYFCSLFLSGRLATSLTTIINARIFHGIALEAEQYADEYEIVLPKVTSR
ncbi:hypothetical protein AGABI1DRAFT_92513 [Agaricus bisporus var. burnettii JB137-S8]|uniref:Uncharacterized protein n=1 Tax=Agaricus bisporus var. burnettii (strain JB137-S8 / ATCC MYA-4627 / FGSC 10392) TaxID=597362 RepID=K5X7P8_AGABU|nr:uncharacterized protein AGABI1DRAFT_92513 [Agaricus bisporus var. burnettii JB137-S8]EKM79007.1 hypothetical protein AGABI1DRAFT_92513 [Agaricus bisporus var. burnettii JB137-S8]